MEPPNQPEKISTTEQASITSYVRIPNKGSPPGKEELAFWLLLLGSIHGSLQQVMAILVAVAYAWSYADEGRIRHAISRCVEVGRSARGAVRRRVLAARQEITRRGREANRRRCRNNGVD